MGSQNVKKTIKKQLQTLGCYIDDELPEYIMMMIANKRTQTQMVEDLVLFLNDEAEKFVSWLVIVLGRIQKAMELPDIDAIIEGAEESEDLKKKTKKVKKDRKISESEEIRRDDKHERKRRSRDGKGEVEEKEKEKKKPESPQNGKEIEGKENEKREKECDSKMADQSISDEECSLARDEEISKRRAAREQRDKEYKERREERKKKEREEQEEKENRDKERQRRHREEREKEKSRISGDVKDGKENAPHSSEGPEQQSVNGVQDVKDVRKQAENEAKRIENKESRNPMEFVKRIAKDISLQIMTEPGSEKKGNNTETKMDVDVDFRREAVNNTDLTFCENVSLQAVSQYEDKENDDKEKG